MESKKKDSALVRSSAAEYLTFVASTGEDKDSIEMRYEDENIWLTQKMMATLYDVGLPTINEHIKKIYADHEQDEAATIRKFRIVQNEGGRQVTRSVNHYNLQMIIAVGFKVNNQRAVRFRVWANQIVEQYTIKGWAMDEERLKNGGTVLPKKYFEVPLTMEDWAKRLDIYLQADDLEVLKDAGKISAQLAKMHAETEFEKYRVVQMSIGGRPQWKRKARSWIVCDRR